MMMTMCRFPQMNCPFSFQKWILWKGLMAGLLMWLGSAVLLTAQLPASVPDGFDVRPNGLVTALAVQSDGAVLIGGAFNRIGTANRLNLARVNADGTLDTSFNPAPNAPVFQIQVLNNGQILVAGEFTSIAGGTRSWVARLNSDGSRDNSFNATALGGGCYALLLLEDAPDSEILVGGDGYLRKLDHDGNPVAGFPTGIMAGGRIEALAKFGDDYLVGGGFAAPRLNFFRVSSAGVVDVGFGAIIDGAVHSIAVLDNGKIVIGGEFSTVGAQFQPLLGVLGNDGLRDPNFTVPVFVGLGGTQYGGDGAVRRILPVGPDRFFAVGDASFDPDGSKNFVALLTDTGLDNSYGVTVGGPVFAVAASLGNRLLIGGTFSTVASQSRTNLARLASSTVVATVTIDPVAGNVGEADGSFDFTLTMSQAMAVPIAVPITYGGTATNNKDYTRPASPIVFAPGEVEKTLTLQILDDDLVENDETVIVTVGAIADPEVAAGVPNQGVLTILDDEEAPAITQQPVSQIVAEGSLLEIPATVTGVPVPTLQWRRNSRNVSGATTVPFLVDPVSLNHAGRYQLRARGGGVTVNSDVVTVTVVDTQDKKVPAPDGGRARIQARFSSPEKVTFKWFKDDVEIDPLVSTNIRGLNSGTLTVSALTLLDAANYRCEITSSAGMLPLSSGDLELVVYTDVPEVVGGPLTLTPAMVSEDYEYIMPIDPDPLKTPTRFLIRGLPRGLKYDRVTGRIFGRPLIANTYDRIQIIPSNAIGRGTMVEATMLVSDLPVNTAGTYVGLIEPDADVTGQLGGDLNFRVTARGAVSGTLRVGGERRRFRSVLDTEHPVGNPSFVAVASRGRVLPAYELDVSVIDTVAREFSGVLGRADLVVTTAVFGYQQADPVVDYSGNHNVSLRLTDVGEIADEANPQGHGFLAVQINAKGRVRLRGRAGDGTTLSASSVTSLDGKINWFQPLYRNTGSVWALLNVADDAFHTFSVPFPGRWQRNVQTRPRERLYKDGFTSLQLGVTGGFFAPLVSGEIPLGLADAADNAKLTFTRGDVVSAVLPPDVVFTLGAGSRGAMPTVQSGNNPNGTTFSINRRTGVFSGRFTLVNVVNGNNLSRRVNYQGTLFGDGLDVLASGYFLLAQLPVGLEPANTTPILSGVVELSAP
jgi:hypothetical protein